MIFIDDLKEGAFLFCKPGDTSELHKVARELRIPSMNFLKKNGFVFYKISEAQAMDAVLNEKVKRIPLYEAQAIIASWVNPPERDYSPLVFIDGDYQKIDQHIEKNYQFTEKQLKEAEHRQKNPTIVHNARSKG